MQRPRSRASARAAGTRFESSIANYLAMVVDDRIERRTRNGNKDRGDIGGLRMSPALRSGRIVVECKDTTRATLATWAKETEIERGNDDALVGVIVHKRVGTTKPGSQWVTMTMDDFVALITGERPVSP